MLLRFIKYGSGGCRRNALISTVGGGRISIRTYFAHDLRPSALVRRCLIFAYRSLSISGGSSGDTSYDMMQTAAPASSKDNAYLVGVEEINAEMEMIMGSNSFDNNYINENDSNNENSELEAKENSSCNQRVNSSLSKSSQIVQERKSLSLPPALLQSSISAAPPTSMPVHLPLDVAAYSVQRHPWIVLSDPDAASEPEKLRRRLFELGIKIPFHLDYLEKEDVEELSKYLKKIPQKEFIRLMHQIPKKNRIVRFDIEKRFTNAILYDNTVYMSGQVGEGKSIEEQTRSVLSEIDKALASAGSDKSNILELTIWLSDIARDYKAVNEIYDSWITPGKPPPRACVQARLYSQDCLIEIRCIAARFD